MTLTDGLKRVAPQAPAHPGPTPVEARLHERIQALEAALQRTSTSADPEAIHDLRVEARRMTAFIRMWRALVPAGCFGRIVRDLRALRRRAGRARDLEVQVEMLRERLGRHEAPEDAARAILRKLEAPLERRRRRVAKRAGARRSRRLMTLLSRVERGMRKDLVSHLEAYEIAHAREEERRHAAVDGLKAALETADDAELHRTRIAIKKWRYAVESLGENGTGAVLDRLRPLQDALGSALDRTALRAELAALTSESGHGRATRTLTSVLAELDAERFEQLQRFRSIGRDFLRSMESPARAESRVGAG